MLKKYFVLIMLIISASSINTMQPKMHTICLTPGSPTFCTNCQKWCNSNNQDATFHKCPIVGTSQPQPKPKPKRK